MNITKGQFNRTVKDFKVHAKESVKVEFRNGEFLVLCSELAMYRISEKYKHAPVDTINKGYSPSLCKHYFILKTNFGGEFSTD